MATETSSMFAASSAPTTLNFPPEVYAKLFPRAYLLAHLHSSPSIRANGRLPSESRRLVVHKSSLTHTAGSAIVRLGDTTVVCGVRAEILNVTDVGDWRGLAAVGVENESGIAEEDLRMVADRKDGEGDEEGMDDENGKHRTEEDRVREDAQQLEHLNLLVPNVELATGCSPLYLPGSPPSNLAQSLTQRLLTLLHQTRLVRLQDLEIWNRTDDTPHTFSTAVEARDNPGHNDSLEPPTCSAKYSRQSLLDVVSGCCLSLP